MRCRPRRPGTYHFPLAGTGPESISVAAIELPFTPADAPRRRKDGAEAFPAALDGPRIRAMRSRPYFVRLYFYDAEPSLRPFTKQAVASSEKRYSEFL